MKKILYFIICFALVFAMLSVSVFAEAPETDASITDTAEDTTAEPEISPESPEEDAPLELPEEEPDEEHTVFTRVWEYINVNLESILGFLADGFVVVIAFLLTKGGKKMAMKLMGLISKGASEDTQTKLVEGFNAMLEENTALKSQVETLKASVEKANSELIIVHKETKAVLESMFNVWGQSANLPQCLKDLVATQYAACMKAEGTDDAEGKNT